MRRHQRGQVMAFVLIFSPVLLLAVGLVVDGGLALAARARAYDEANAAALAGARDIDQGVLRRTGEKVLDVNQATHDAQLYLAGTGHKGSVSVSLTEVRVTVSITQPMRILSIIGVDSMTATEDGAAKPEHGVVGAEP